MFISFLLPYIDRGQGPIFHWVMAAQISKLGSEEVILIADERYFSTPLNWGKSAISFGVSYQNPDIDQWHRVRKILLKADIFDELETRSHSMLEAFRILLTQDYRPLSQALRQIFVDIFHEMRPEAVLTWCNVPSLELVAAEFNLPVIHNELGPFRHPNYQGTIYFDFRGVNGNTSAANEMAAFLEEVRQEDGFCPLNMEELRKIFMTDPSRALKHPAKLLESGAALQVEDDSNLLAFNQGMNNFELIFAARKGLTPGELLIRRHPNGHLQYGSSLGVPDDSADSIQFISRCEHIFCTNSSIAFEALLLEKPVHLLGDSPAACLSHERLSRFSPRDLLISLNYLFLGYLAPISLLFDANYYRWRLTLPSLRKIFERHLDIFQQIRKESTQVFRQKESEPRPIAYGHSFTNPDDVLWIGIHLYQQERYEESRPLFEAVMRWQEAHPDQRAEACFHLAEISRFKGDEEQWRNFSIAGLKILEEWDSEDVKRSYKMGMRLYLLGEWRRSQAFLQSVIDFDSTDLKQRADSYVMLAQTHRQLGEIQQWARLMIRVIDEFGVSQLQPCALFDICIWLCHEGDWDRSRRGFEYLVESKMLSGSQLAEACFQLAETYLQEGQDHRWRNLVQSGIQALEAIEPKDTTIVLKLAGRLRDIGDPMRSLPWLEHLIISESEKCDRRFDVLWLFLDISRNLSHVERKKSLSVLAKSIENMASSSVGPWWRLGETFVELEMWEKGREWYIELLRIQDMNCSQRIEIMAMLSIIDEHLERNNWRNWLECMAETEATYECLADTDAYRIASLFKRASRHNLASEWFNRALEMARSDSLRAGVYFHLGELALWQKNSCRARELFSRCLNLNPQHIKARSLFSRTTYRTVPVP